MAVSRSPEYTGANLSRKRVYDGDVVHLVSLNRVRFTELFFGSISEGGQLEGPSERTCPTS